MKTVLIAAIAALTLAVAPAFGQHDDKDMKGHDMHSMHMQGDHMAMMTKGMTEAEKKTMMDMMKKWTPAEHKLMMSCMSNCMKGCAGMDMSKMTDKQKMACMNKCMGKDAAAMSTMMKKMTPAEQKVMNKLMMNTCGMAKSK